MSRSIKNNPDYLYWRQFRTYATKRDELYAYLELIEEGYQPNNRFRKRSNPRHHITSWEDVGFASYQDFSPKENKVKKALEKIYFLENNLLQNLFFTLQKHGYNFEIRKNIFLLTGHCVYGFITDRFIYCDRILPLKIQHCKQLFNRYRRKLLKEPGTFQLVLPISINDLEINSTIASLKELKNKSSHRYYQNKNCQKYINRYLLSK